MCVFRKTMYLQEFLTLFLTKYVPIYLLLDSIALKQIIGFHFS